MRRGLTASGIIAIIKRPVSHPRNLPVLKSANLRNVTRMIDPKLELKNLRTL